MWSILTAVLKRELFRRGLWSRPPSYLGIYGWSRWTEGRGAAGGDPLEELTSDCYLFVFVVRLWSLKQQLTVKENIDGLALLSIRNFISERQRRHDPLGFHVFQTLRAAIHRAVDTGDLVVVSGDSRIRNETVLAGSLEAAPGEEEDAELDERVRRWNDRLFPALITARGKRREVVIEQLTELIRGLATKRSNAFRFKALIDPLKHDARARWAALLRHEVGETAIDGGGEEPAEIVRWIPPDTSLEEGQSFGRLLTAVGERIERLDTSEATRGYLLALWQLLRSYADDAIQAPLAGPAEAAGVWRLPSRRRIASLLDIPRNRMPELFATIGRLLEESQDAIRRSPPLALSEESHPR